MKAWRWIDTFGNFQSALQASFFVAVFDWIVLGIESETNEAFSINDILTGKDCETNLEKSSKGCCSFIDNKIRLLVGKVMFSKMSVFASVDGTIIAELLAELAGIICIADELWAGIAMAVVAESHSDGLGGIVEMSICCCCDEAICDCCSDCEAFCGK